MQFYEKNWRVTTENEFDGSRQRSESNIVISREPNAFQVLLDSPR